MTTEDDGRDENPGPDDVLLAALAEGLSHRKAAEVASVSLATVTRRLRDETFRERVRVEREARADEAVAMLEGASVKAAETMVELLAQENPIARHKAAADILSRSDPRQRALGERLGRLEDLVGQLVTEKTGPRRLAS